MKAVFGAAVLLFIIGSVASTFYGLYLAFSASIILGVIVLLIEPLPLILGVLGFLGHPEVAQRIATWLGM